jgi:methylenetetrahydrofolate reductase (NADPH)
MTNKLRQAFESGEFVVTCEVIPGRGACEPGQIKEFDEGKEIFASGRVHAISITDNPSGNPALLADAFGQDFLAAGVTPLVHFTCKDRSRNQMQSQFYAMQRCGIENVLVMTGDYQSSGWQGTARPVFDLDPVQALGMIADMNQGLVQQTPRGEIVEQAANFFAGAVVSPFKYREGEVIPQYLKLERKIIAGANYIITQLGYDARKMQELKLYLDGQGYETPLVANIFLLNAGAARLMRKGTIAGCYVSDELMALLEDEAKTEDKGKAARYERAAKMVAIAKGLGYGGIHIGGFGLTAEGVTSILDRAEALAGDWQKWAREISFGAPDGFYLYKPELDAAGQPTGLNLPELAARTEQVKGRKMFGGYGLSRFFHHWVLTQDKRFCKVLASIMERKERKKGLKRHHGLEHLGKTVLYGCMDCGDCGLEAAIYTCPMTQCPKCQRNGPCGGGMDGWCEVYPGERYCIHYKAYHRLKKYNEIYKMSSYITPPNNWDFYETSGWSNYTHKRDNAARRIPVKIGLEKE